MLISIDDLNDWVGAWGGHPQAKTPHIDRLARRAVRFTNAHCAAPLCNPSRAAFFSGLHPLQTGITENDDSDIRRIYPGLVLLPQHFAAAGYETYGAGKLLHLGSGSLFQHGYFPHLRWSPFSPADVLYTDAELGLKGTPDQRHIVRLAGRQFAMPLNRIPSDRNVASAAGESFDWGPLPVEDADMGDGKIARWGAEILNRPREMPFFMAIGFYRPHIPLFAPEKYFEIYNDVDIALPPHREDDLDDLGPTARRIAHEADTAGLHSSVVQHDGWHDAVRAYLACTSFIDAQVGLLLEALEQGGHDSNTVVLLWSDHGWHLGEKEHWGKWTLWRRSTLSPLLIALPSGERGRRDAAVASPVSLLDAYPTLIELCNLPAKPELAGQSLAPLLRTADANMEDRSVLTVMGADGAALSGRRWRYIRYADGERELYDLRADPNEWHNLAGAAAHQTRVDRLDAELTRQLEEFSSRRVGDPLR
ncbi:MAG TPA: sulfatase [Lacipirellulaceae bacterium]|nr:sulfatase [Lacipirellulaceae bacterium]